MLPTVATTIALSAATLFPQAAPAKPPAQAPAPDVQVATVERDFTDWLHAWEMSQVDTYVHAVQMSDVVVYVNAVAAADWEAQRAAQQTVRPAPATTPRANWSSDGLGPCGGDLPPCYVKARESGGDYNAQNPTSSASGAWQFLDSTWDGYGGYSRAADAPPDVQDAHARETWAGGAGCSHWSAC